MCKRDNHPFFDCLDSLMRRGIKIKAIRVQRDRFERECQPVPPYCKVEFRGVPVTLVDKTVLRMRWYSSPPQETLTARWRSEPRDPLEFPPDAWAV